MVNNESGASVVYAAEAGQYYGGVWNGVAAEGLQRSTDGGSTWTQVVPNVSGSPVVPADIEIAADGEIWVGTKHNVYGMAVVEFIPPVTEPHGRLTTLILHKGEWN